MTTYGNPLAHVIPLILTVLAAIGVAVYAARNSTLTYTPNPVPDMPRNCTACRDVLSATNQACQGCVDGSNWRPRV